MEINKIQTSYKVYYKDETVSTNIDAIKSEAADDKSVFIAEKQTGGKGSRGRSWVSDEGDGIWMSILLIPKLPLSDIPKITPCAGLAVCSALLKNGCDAGIKWPNDIIINSKKVCGILTEKRGEKVVVGIGINVNTERFDAELCEKATSLYIETGRKTEREKLISDILADFERFYDLLRSKGFSALKKSYAECSVTLGKKVKVIQPCEEYEAYAVEIGDNGELIVERDGEKISLCSGEVSVRGINGYVS